MSVAFSGGLLSLGPIARDVNGVVLRVGTTVIRMTPGIGSAIAALRQ